MTVIAFPRALPTAKDRRYKVLLVKAGTRRLFEVRPCGDQWQCWVRINGQQVWAQLTDEAPHLDRIARDMQEIVAALRADGWTDA
jgi:hypothetical protein